MADKENDKQSTDPRRTSIATPMIMNLDSDPTTLKPEEFSFVLNGVPEFDIAGSPFISTEEANTLSTVRFPVGYILNGFRRIDSDNTVVFLANSARNVSQIGLVTKGLYSPRIESDKLGFHERHQIDARVKRIFNGNLIVYWTDNNKPMRYMNLDNIPYVRIPDGFGGFINSTELDIDQINVFKNYDVADIDIPEVINNGLLKTGGYFITAQYADGRGNGLTSWFKLSNKIPIFRDNLDEPFETITGNASNIPTDKAIKIVFNTVDNSFTHINIGAVRQIDGSLSSYLITTIPVNQSEYIYTGSGTETPVLSEDMLVDPTVYDKAKTVEESDGSLVWGDLTGKQPLNLQPYVNKIQIQWQAYQTKAYNRQKSHKNPVFAAYFQSYRRDEVIPLGIVFQFKDGTESNAHPLIGREPDKKSNGSSFTQTVDHYGNPINPLHWDSDIPAMTEDVYEKQNLPRWKIYNTATIEGNKLPPGTDEGLSYYGEMAYWNSTDRYPTNKAVWGDLAGKFIRHPKMPDSSVLHIHDGQNGNRELKVDLTLYHLGITLPNVEEVMNSLPDDFKALITGWRVVRGDRQFDRSVMASGIMSNCWLQQFNADSENLGDLDYRIYPGYPLNDLRKDVYINKAQLTLHEKIVYIMSGPGHLKNYNEKYLKDTFTFYSPDTSLTKSVLSDSELKINVELYGKADCFYNYLDPYPKLDNTKDDGIKSALQGTAIGWYNNFKSVRFGQARRKLDEAMYIPFNAQISGGNAGKVVWNKMRDSSVLLKVSKEIADPTVQDRSRFILTNDDTDGLLEEEKFHDISTDALTVIQHIKRPTSSYYVTIKRNLPNQYGNISAIKFRDTGFTDKRYKREGIIMGGDTYIGLYANKKQMVFSTDVQKWINTADGGEGMDTLATESIPGIRFFYRNVGEKPRTHSVMMLKDNGGIFDSSFLGFLPSMMFGVPVFWAESDVNVDIRYEGPTSAEAFFPSLLNGALAIDQWLSVLNVDKDNSNYANQDLSGYNNLKYYSHDDLLFEPGNSDLFHYYSRAIKSLRSQPEDIYDNWQVYKPLDYYDFPKSRGSIVDIRYIGEGRTLFRLEQTLYVTQLIQTLQSTGAEIALGTGRLFAQEPYELQFTDLGYSGTENQWACDVTPFGTFMVNSRKGKIFEFVDPGRMYNLSQGFTDLTGAVQKAEVWFENNLPFKLSTQIDGMPTDNPYNPNGIGCHSVWDQHHKLWILTKKDYELADAKMQGQFVYQDGYIYLNGRQVNLTNTDLFINRSFTIAYSPIHKGWFSFKSYIPDAFMPLDRNFMSVITEGGLSTVYDHIPGNKYLEFFGKQAPFVIEFANKIDGVTAGVSDYVTFISKAFIKIGRDMVYVGDRSFNKAIVSNNNQCSGQLLLTVQDENKLNTLYTSLKASPLGKMIPLRLRDGRWNFADYSDIANGNGPIFTSEWDQLQFQYFIDKVLNKAGIDYTAYNRRAPSIRGQYSKTRLVLDNSTDLKLLFQLAIEGARVSFA